MFTHVWYLNFVALSVYKVGNTWPLSRMSVAIQTLTSSCDFWLHSFIFSPIQYVIKKLNLSTSSKRERRSAEQEAQLLSQLRHPNIVTYRESWEGDDRQLYIVMGFCEGGDLYHRLKQQKGELLPERQVVEWFVQIAMALQVLFIFILSTTTVFTFSQVSDFVFQYLHERNILHRDLKTQNIFLTKTNIIKVGDLGIARVLENQNDMASTLIGTPYYMSPELFSNKPYNHKVAPPLDINNLLYMYFLRYNIIDRLCYLISFVQGWLQSDNTRNLKILELPQMIVFIVG